MCPGCSLGCPEEGHECGFGGGIGPQSHICVAEGAPGVTNVAFETFDVPKATFVTVEAARVP
ncbi:hypothetical protein JOM49_000358 [Amycolatopsis magusensis]|uniref:Uncharacterized protein n=1 Tax=Amycolatopsis magusensis TaxID=882444 RepID=A0ABS4PHE6_9PSEU|nr:hypothetical protein [Amycolatopsis magusensis]